MQWLFLHQVFTGWPLVRHSILTLPPFITMVGYNYVCANIIINSTRTPFGKDVVNGIGGIIGSEAGVMVCHHGVTLGFVNTKYSHKHHALFMILGSKKAGQRPR